LVDVPITVGRYALRVPINHRERIGIGRGEILKRSVTAIRGR